MVGALHRPCCWSFTPASTRARISQTTRFYYQHLRMAPVKYLLVSAGLLVSVMADYVAFSEWPTSLTAGQPVTLKWVGGSDAVGASIPSPTSSFCTHTDRILRVQPATIILRKGASTDLQDIQVLSSDATNGEFNWTPPPISRMPTTTLLRLLREMKSITPAWCRCRWLRCAEC